MCRERVSYGITTKVEVTTTTIGVNRSPKRERIFLQKIKFQKVGFLRENFVSFDVTQKCSIRINGFQFSIVHALIETHGKIKTNITAWKNGQSRQYFQNE